MWCAKRKNKHEEEGITIYSFPFTGSIGGKMKRPKVSTVIPTFNRLFQLAELMESLSRQTFQEFEVIIVNDGGERVDILKDVYSNLDIVIVEMDANRGHVHARNEGLKQARGEFILLMDDDDLLVHTHIEKMVEAMDDSDLLYSDVEIVKFEVENNIRMPKSRSLFAYELELEAMRKFSTFVPSGCLYRKSIHNIVGYFDPEVHNYWDWDFFLTVAETHRIKRIPTAGVIYDFSDSNNNQSKETTSRKVYLDRLSVKHNLGPLPTENFFTLLKKPEVMKRRAESELVWDGMPFVSKLALL
jgi:glycosyltransferase involved in cell wall biosynthesis